jgi:hypothetical protein
MFIIYILCLNVKFYLTYFNSKQKIQDTLIIDQIENSFEKNKIKLCLENNLSKDPKNNPENKIIYPNQMKKKENLYSLNEKNCLKNLNGR